MLFKQFVKVFNFGNIDVVISDGNNFKLTVSGRNIDLALSQFYPLANREISEISLSTAHGKTEYWILLKNLTEYERTPKIKDIVKTCQFFNERTKFIIKAKNGYRSLNDYTCDYISAARMSHPVFSVEYDRVCNHARITAEYTSEV